MKKYFFITITIISALIICSFIYKFSNSLNSINNNYYKIHLIFLSVILIGSIITIFLDNKKQDYIIIFIISIVFGLYIVESYLSIYAPSDRLLKKKIKIYKKITGKSYDVRSKYEYYKDVQKNNKNIVLSIPPRFYPSEKIYSLSGISNVKTILCNELGYYSSYESDRYGFNNPDSEWDQPEIKYTIIGDSFSHGACVNRPYDIASNLRSLSKNSVLNLGYSGNGPLEEFATLREYLRPNVENILWLYYPNDLEDLIKELKIDVLNKYLDNLKFNQNLILKQKEIDHQAKKIILKKKRINEFNYFQFIKLNNARGLIYELLPNKYKPSETQIKIGQPLSKFSQILKETKKLTSNNASKLFFVYLPEYSQYKKKYNDTNYQRIKKLVNELEIPFIDLHSLVFQKEINPFNLFPFNLPGHYNKTGYKKISDAIHKSVIDMKN